MPLGAGASLKLMMDKLEALEKTVHTDLRVYRWRPDKIQLPALYNWLPDDTSEPADTAKWRDTLELLAIVGVRHTDSGREHARLEGYVDAFRDVVDQQLWRTNPTLDGTCSSARRIGMRSVTDRFSEIPVLGFEFRLEIQLKRLINP